MAVNWNLALQGWDLTPKEKKGFNIEKAADLYFKTQSAIQQQKQNKLKLDEANRIKRLREDRQNILMDYINPKTGQMDFQGAIGAHGAIGDGQGMLQMRDIMEKQQKDTAQRQKDLQNMKSTVANKLLNFNEAYPGRSENYYNEFVKPVFGGQPWVKDQTLMQMTNLANDKTLKSMVANKDDLERKARVGQFKDYLKSVNLKGISNDKDAYNELSRQIQSGPHAELKESKDFLKSLKQGGSFGENLAKAMVALTAKELGMTGEEANNFGELEPAIDSMNMITGMYQKGQFSGTMLGEATSLLSKTPLVGKRAFPEEAKFNDNKTIMAERFLRAATGAAAPDNEKKTYGNFLPNWGDPADIAQNKIDNFLDHIQAKASKAISKWRIIGSVSSLKKADLAEENIKKMMQSVQRIVPLPLMTDLERVELEELEREAEGYQ